MSAKIYVDLRSQPCRALTIFLKHTDIPYELKCIDLFKGEHKKPEYSTLFPLGTVPGMQDGDYSLAETVAIFRYLTTKYAGSFPDHWYPADVKARGRVDEYIAYHHSGTRGVCVPLFVSEVFVPMRTGKSVPEEQLQREKERLAQGLDKLEKGFLKDSQYLCGDEISFADVLAVCELMQFIVIGRDVTEGRPNLKAFVERVKNRLNPAFDEVHAKVYEWRDSYQKS